MISEFLNMVEFPSQEWGLGEDGRAWTFSEICTHCMYLHYLKNLHSLSFQMVNSTQNSVTIFKISHMPMTLSLYLTINQGFN